MKVIRVNDSTFPQVMERLRLEKEVGFDLESTDTNKLKAHVAVIQVFSKNLQAIFLFPIKNVVEGVLTADYALELAKAYEKWEIVGHNLAYDVGLMHRDFGYTPTKVKEDTYILSLMRQCEHHKLKVLAAEADPSLAGKLKNFEDLMELEEDRDMELIYSFNDAEQVKYMAYDPYLPYIVRDYLWQEDLREAYEAEMGAIIPLAIASIEGLQLNMSEFDSSMKDIVTNMELYQSKVDAGVGYPIKVGSAKQVRVALFERLKLPVPPIKTDKGEISTSEESLNFLRGYPVVDDILELKHLTSVYSSALKIPNYLDENDRVHPQFLQVGFDGTARIYTTKPSVNQWTWESRRLIVPNPGNKFIHADWKSAELYIACYMAGQDDIVKLYNEGWDLHTYLSGLLLGVESPTKEQREISKTLTFATMFGSEGAAVARKLKCSENEAKDLVQRYQRILDKVTDFRLQTHSQAMREGCTRTILGRKRVLPNLYSATLSEKGKRQSFNTKIQGSCADLQKLAFSKLYKKYGDRFKFRFTVFDSFLIECPDDVSDEEIKKVLDDISDFSDRFPGFKLRYDYGVAYDWDSAHKLA